MTKTNRFQIITAVLTIVCTAATFAVAQSATVAGIDIDQMRASGYRLDWMNQSNGSAISLPTITTDSLYTVDEEDYLTRYDLETGKWIWSSPVGNKIYNIHSINEMQKGNTVYAVSDGAIYALEKETGNLPTSSDQSTDSKSITSAIRSLDWIANTGAISTEKGYLIYGSSNGEVVWFNPDFGFETKRYRIGDVIKVTPTFAHGPRSLNGQQLNLVITPSLDGQVYAVDLEQANKIWSIQLTSPVQTEISYGTNSSLLDDETFPRTSAFIAGTDQYLRAIDLHTGKPRWNILSSKVLVDSPVVVSDTVYQRLPEIGLAAYDAFPDSLSGNQKWIADDVFGNVITTTNTGKLVCWDSVNNLLQIVDPVKGGVVSTLPLPGARSVLSDTLQQGSIYIITQNNALLRLIQRH
ncbi:MAG: PQQ-binding-like beta-propeller repeat protein [Phycisphaerae bacterium]|nr:PQQ-binding-like beta-propeller repeat protein [Phycisphaerae bacterium]